MNRTISTLILAGVCAASFTCAVKLQHTGIKKMMPNPPFYETWQFTGRSGAVMKVMALRYDLVFADFLWLRSIQSFGGRGMTNRDWRPLYNLFDSITELDPYFQEAYTFGNLVIGDEGGHQREGLQLLHKGTFNLYKQYRIPFEGMYVAHWSMQDKPTARWYGRMATKRIDSPEWVQRIVAYIDIEAGAYYIGMDRFIGNFMQAMDAKDGTLEYIALDKQRETVDKWAAEFVLKAVDEYTSSTGKKPKSIDELASMPSLQNYEIANIQKTIAAVEVAAKRLNKEGIKPDLLARLKLALPSPAIFASPEIQNMDSSGKSKFADYQNAIFKASLERRSGIPIAPSGAKYILNLALLGRKGIKSTEIVGSPENLQEFTKNLLMQYRQVIDERKAQLGRPPKNLKEVFYTDLLTPEPAGGTWIYKPETGEIASSTYPEL
jgi:hypothetical protein